MREQTPQHCPVLLLDVFNFFCFYSCIVVHGILIAVAKQFIQVMKKKLGKHQTAAGLEKIHISMYKDTYKQKAYTKGYQTLYIKKNYQLSTFLSQILMEFV